MLYIQDICLIWHKIERGGKYSIIRSKFPYSYLLDKKINQTECYMNRLEFYQIKDKILKDVEHSYLMWNIYNKKYSKENIERKKKIDRFYNQKFRHSYYKSVNDCNIESISILKEENSYRIKYFYDERSMPYRHGHNEDFNNINSRMYFKDICNETAFILSDNQYGRVVYNCRKNYQYTNNWWYELHIINFLNAINDIPQNIFVKNKPDFEYKQMANLF